MTQGTTLPGVSLHPEEVHSFPCIHHVFEARAKECPEATAVSQGEETLSYRELNARANQLAQRLVKLGVGPEVPVALYLDRSPFMVLAILGVLKAGGAYVPIDLAYPKDRLEFMLEDTQAAVLITQSDLLKNLPPGKHRSLCIDAPEEQLESECSEAPPSEINAQNAAYIIYTSGSTGKPKGVVVTHHNVVRLLKSTEHWYGFSQQDIWPLFHSYAFDVSVWELWGSLFNGGRLVIVPYLITRNPSEFYELLAREKVTVLNQTPSAFRQLIWAEETAPTKHQLCLRYVICAGEALELQSLRPWFARHGDQQPKVVNMYGITETTVHSTFRIIRHQDVLNNAGSVIGVPIPDLQLYLVDEELKPVKNGAPGEICIGGAGVARGYLNRPDLTAKRFVPDPFSSEPAARLYRSGDLAQYNAAGELEYLGRMDHQVKIRGFRVELGEIESALNGHHTVRESIVMAQDDGNGGKRLVAYVVPVKEQPQITELREHLGKTLPNYMLPAAFVFLPKLPLNTNGKVDRRALPQPDSARPQLRNLFRPPATREETVLAAIWSDVLNISPIGIDDNYFELGGDSIRSIMILARAQQQGVRRSVEQLFANPTIAGLVKCPESTAMEQNSASTLPFSLISDEDRAKLGPDIEDAYPLTKLQLGMFYHNELDPLSARYHDVFSYRVEASWNPDRLRQAIQRVSSLHSSLRTSFHLAGFSQPLQLVHCDPAIPFGIEEIAELDEKEQNQHIERWIETEKRRAFERSTAPLFRFHAMRLRAEAFQFFVSFHHSCLDGWSLAALVTEIIQAYAGFLQGSSHASEKPGVTYRDFVALELQSLSSQPSRSFWSGNLKDCTPGKLPRWPESMRARGHEQLRGPELYIEGEVLDELKRLARDAGVPLKTVLLAAHQHVLSFVYGQDDVTTGFICNGRPEQADAEKMTGLFLNTLPLRQRLEGGTWLELIRQTFTAEQALMPHRRFPLAEIQKLAGGQPLFETAFDFVHFHVLKDIEKCQGIRLAEGPYFEANNLTTYTTFMLNTDASRLELHIDYDPNEITRQQIEEFSQYYLTALRAMTEDPNARYEKLGLLSESEARRITVDWNATQTSYPREKNLVALFDEVVQRAPDSVALVCGSTRLTYAQLATRAGAIAQQLKARPIGHNELVGLSLERTVDLVASLLGILKAGGAYLPLDPAYPQERLAYMVNDSGVSCVLTEEKSANKLPQDVQLLYVGDAPVAFQESDSQAQTREGDDANNPLAYVIYTSGSTGKPKGVQVYQHSVVNLLKSFQQRLGFTAQDNLLAVTTLSFDIAGLELFLPLISGGQLTLATREQAADGSQLCQLIECSQPTVMQATPATWRLLLESGWHGNRSLKVLCGGEALKRELADDLLSRTKAVWNVYGPTETTIWSTAWQVQAHEPISVGRPLANTQVYITDRHLRPVPVGTTGELHIAGDGVAKGYLNQPELTARKFIANPFSTNGGARMYKTGDLARYLPDGRVECLGRTDNQVKIRGYRIEPGEIETLLRQHTGLADALVTAREDSIGEKHLIGYVISKNGPPSFSELRDFMKSRLPLHMVPAHFVLLKEFPLTPNGKVDRNRLPAPGASQQRGRSYTPPRNPGEELLATIWQEVLECSPIGIDDNFFELGGDSLSATRAFARMNRSLGLGLTLREMLERPTIRSLSELLHSTNPSATSTTGMIPRQPRLRTSHPLSK